MREPFIQKRVLEGEDEEPNLNVKLVQRILKKGG